MEETDSLPNLSPGTDDGHHSEQGSESDEYEAESIHSKVETDAQPGNPFLVNLTEPRAMSGYADLAEMGYPLCQNHREVSGDSAQGNPWWQFRVPAVQRPCD